VLSGKTTRAEADRLTATRGGGRAPDAVAATLAEVVAALD
jgi:hypothetical protein